VSGGTDCSVGVTETAERSLAHKPFDRGLVLVAQAARCRGATRGTGCSVASDQYTMVRCRGCGGWFCPEHIDAQEGVRLVRPVVRALHGLAFYQGVCVPCHQADQRTHH
jgi:hypothetical protein